MNFNFNTTQQNDNLQTVSDQARCLMSARRQRIQHRKQAMLNRVAVEVGIEA